MEGNNEKARLTYEQYHSKIKNLMGDKYDEKVVNGTMVLQAPGVIDKIYNELEQKLKSAKNEDDRGVIIDAWIQEHDAMPDDFK